MNHDRDTFDFSQGQIRMRGALGVPKLKDRTEIRINTTQDNIRKPQTAMKLPEIFEILRTAWFCITANRNLK